MERGKLYSAHGQLVTCQDHDRRVARRSQVPQLYRVVCAARRNEIFVLVEVHRQYLIGVSVNLLYVSP